MHMVLPWPCWDGSTRVPLFLPALRHHLRRNFPTGCSHTAVRCSRMHWEKVRPALYYDLRDKLERLLQDRRMGAFLMQTLPPSTTGPASRRNLADVFDGDIINNLRKLWPSLHVIYVAMVQHHWRFTCLIPIMTIQKFACTVQIFVRQYR